MKIASATLQMNASHASLTQHETRESLRMWVGANRPEEGNRSSRNIPAQPPANDTVTLSEAGRSAQTETDHQDEIENDPKLRLIRSMVEMLTGRQIRVFDPAELDAPENAAAPTAPPPAANEASPPAQRAGYGVEYERHETYHEIEQTEFSASGQVTTADGRTISFDLKLSMAREYYEESHTSLRLGDAARKVDPLVLNFSGTAAQLTDQRFAFDLNSDGKTENIARLAAGSGYLAFDRNQDGVINNGKELFGPSSNDGFAELAQLDDDRNGWIDENDAAFTQLSVWDGSGQLRSLKETGVGAIALANVATPFALKTGSNQSLGDIRNSGIFLQEDGRAGTIQQIDLTA